MFRTLLLLLLSTSLAFAAGDKSASIKESLQKYQSLIGPVDQVNPSPIAGLYEVVTGDHIFYTDEKVEILIDGQMFDLNNRRNLTEARARTLFAVEFDKLPLNIAMKKVKGDGSRKMAYFTDPNCGYCKKLEQELKSIDNVTLYLFMYPIFNGSAEKVQGVLCSKDPVKAWDQLMQDGVQPKAGNCKVPTNEVMALGRKLKVNGTPALIFANGVINPGFLPADRLEQALNENK
ncbi:MAG: DsbC family protein [Gammaproteobacteria bacterium]|nr:DsbC family protein [Gammaproteobacteria bacterium]MBU1624161.1 DsbC family protein [Gammaproteobacteria bacterium]MBU1981889.1 DsbC family protein [Gammaproteobacteria bacterium]